MSHCHSVMAAGLAMCVCVPQRLATVPVRTGATVKRVRFFFLLRVDRDVCCVPIACLSLSRCWACPTSSPGRCPWVAVESSHRDLSRSTPRPQVDNTLPALAVLALQVRRLRVRAIARSFSRRLLGTITRRSARCCGHHSHLTRHNALLASAIENHHS